jgi:hypothetical protein
VLLRYLPVLGVAPCCQQLIPWVALVVLAIATGLALTTFRWGRIAAGLLALLVLGASVYGVLDHTVVNYNSGPLDQRLPTRGNRCRRRNGGGTPSPKPLGRHQPWRPASSEKRPSSCCSRVCCPRRRPRAASRAPRRRLCVNNNCLVFVDMVAAGGVREVTCPDESGCGVSAGRVDSRAAPEWRSPKPASTRSASQLQTTSPSRRSVCEYLALNGFASISLGPLTHMGPHT